MSKMRLALVALVVVVLAVGAWLLVRPTSYADSDWSALPPAESEVAAPWEPDPEQLAQLSAVDPCALLRSVDPDAPGPEPVPDGCRTSPRWDELRVEVLADPEAGLPFGNGSPSSFAYNGQERDAAGFTAWEVPASSGAGHCAVFVPAGAEHGLLVRAASGPLCGVLGERVAATLETWRDDPASVAARSGTPTAAELPFTPAGELSLRGRGACVDLSEQWAQRCAEHVDRDVPADPVDAIREGEADPDVACAAALTAAEEAAPEVDVRAVTATQRVPDGARACVLLVEERDSEVWIRASRDAVDASTEFSVGGHPVSENQPGGPIYAIALDDPSERGMVEVTFDALDGSLTEPAWSRSFLESLAAELLD